MAHELEIMENGEASMAYVGEVPWHGLGKRVPADLSPEQMLKAANLDWTVQKVPLFYNVESGPVMTNARALVRSTDQKLLTVVSEAWKPVQNIEAFEFFNDFVQAGDMEMHTAGSLRDGKMVWAMAQIKESFELFGGDKVDGYLLFRQHHYLFFSCCQFCHVVYLPSLRFILLVILQAVILSIFRISSQADFLHV